MPRLFVPVFLLWHDFERVLWGWAWQSPFQCVRKLVPRIVGRHPRTAQKRPCNDAEEEQEGCKAKERAP